MVSVMSSPNKHSKAKLFYCVEVLDGKLPKLTTPLPATVEAASKLASNKVVDHE